LKNRPIEGLKAFIKAYQISISIDYIDGSIESLNGIAAINREYGQVYKSLEIQIFCLRELEKSKLFVKDYVETLGYTLDATSKCFLATNQPDSAIHFAERGLNIATVLDDKNLTNSFNTVIGQSLFHKGNLKDSKQILEPLIGDTEGETLADIYYYLGRIYSMDDRKDKAITCFSSYDSIVSALGYPRIDHAEEVYQILLSNSIANEDFTKRQTFLNNLVYYDSLMESTNTEVEKISSIKFKLIQDEPKNENRTVYLLTIALVLVIGSSLTVRRFIPNRGSTGTKSTIKPTSTIPSELVNQVLSQLKKWERNQGFLEPNITQVELAATLGTNSSYLSKVINEQLGLSYSNYIKNLRTEYIIRDFNENYEVLIKKSMIQLAESYGFRSQDSFVRAFKNRTGKTPSFYLKEKKNENYSP
jgi:AraC-like DNA-binding protein